MNTGLFILGGSILVADHHHITACWGIRILTQPGFIPSANKALQIEFKHPSIHDLNGFFMIFLSKTPFPENFPTEKPPFPGNFHEFSHPLMTHRTVREPAPPLLAGSNGGKGRVLGAPGASSRRRRSCLSVEKPHPCDVLKVPKEQCLRNIPHRIRGAAIYGNMDPINIPPMLAYIPAPWILWVLS